MTEELAREVRRMDECCSSSGNGRFGRLRYNINNSSQLPRRGLMHTPKRTTNGVLHFSFLMSLQKPISLRLATGKEKSRKTSPLKLRGSIGLSPLIGRRSLLENPWRSSAPWRIGTYQELRAWGRSSRIRRSSLRI